MVKVLVNGKSFVIDDGTTVTGLLQGLEVKPAGIAVELNQEIVPRAEHAKTVLRENDALEIVRMTGGG